MLFIYVSLLHSAYKAIGTQKIIHNQYKIESDKCNLHVGQS